MRKTALLLSILVPLFGLKPKAQAPAVQWLKCLGGNGGDYAHSIEPTSDGGYIVAGRVSGPGGDITGYHGTNNNWDYWLVKLDATGAIQWSKCLGGAGDDMGMVVHQAPDGGYVVAGQSSS